MTTCTPDISVTILSSGLNGAHMADAALRSAHVSESPMVGKASVHTRFSRGLSYTGNAASGMVPCDFKMEAIIEAHNARKLA